MRKGKGYGESWKRNSNETKGFGGAERKKKQQRREEGERVTAANLGREKKTEKQRPKKSDRKSEGDLRLRRKRTAGVKRAGAVGRLDCRGKELRVKRVGTSGDHRRGISRHRCCRKLHQERDFLGRQKNATRGRRKKLKQRLHRHLQSISSSSKLKLQTQRWSTGSFPSVLSSIFSSCEI